MKDSYFSSFWNTIGSVETKHKKQKNALLKMTVSIFQPQLMVCDLNIFTVSPNMQNHANKNNVHYDTCVYITYLYF